MKNVYICQLSEKEQNNIRARIVAMLTAEGYAGDELGGIVANAMDSKIVDVLPELELYEAEEVC